MNHSSFHPQSREEAVYLLGVDRRLAHRVLFPHRRPQKSPEFHDIMIDDWHSDIKNVQTQAFRGGAKSTIAEEAIIIQILNREFTNGLVIGETLDRAQERLKAIRHEFETNEMILKLYGNLQGGSWGETELEFSTGRRILAMGRGQAIRGVKYHDMRPDMVFCDDLENLDSTRNPENRKKTKQWFFRELEPACDAKKLRMRMAATPLDRDALSETLRRTDRWKTRVFPIEYLDENGERRSAWPDRFPLEEIDRTRQHFIDIGMMREFNIEYMCQCSAREDKTFHEQQFIVEPQVRTWQAVYAMFDPARTTNANSATTGFACWSWIGPRLVVWDAWGRKLMPDEIVNAVFQCHEDYNPAWIGMELDGLEEFIKQPLRSEQVRRGLTLPIKGVRAPKGKLDFIRGLQPYFAAREVKFAQELPDLQKQLLSFPTGAIDVPNALAYALALRPGAPVYSEFGVRHVTEDLRPNHTAPVWLCLNAGTGHVTGVLMQSIQGVIRVISDLVREGEASDVLRGLVSDAQLEAGGKLRICIGPHHRDKFNNLGLAQALKRMQMDYTVGTPPDTGKAEIRSLLQRERNGFPMLCVSNEAKWTLNAFAGGYALAMQKHGMFMSYAEEGVYRTLMEGVESFVGLQTVRQSSEENEDVRYDYAGGRRYMSALPRR